MHFLFADDTDAHIHTHGLKFAKKGPSPPSTYFPRGCDHAVLCPSWDQPPERLADLCGTTQALCLCLGGGVLQRGLKSLRQSN